MTTREKLQAIEDRLSMMVWDVTARSPGIGEINECRRLRAVVGQRWDSVNRIWEPLEAGDTDLV